MAQSKIRELDPLSKAQVAQMARRQKELKAIGEMADENMLETEQWRTIAPEHLEAIKVRLLAGDTLGNICRGLGIDRGAVLMFAYHNPDFSRDYLAFKAFGAHALYERLIDMIDDKTMTTGDKLFAEKVINGYTKKINPEVYGDRTAVDLSTKVQVSMPQWVVPSLPAMIDGEIVDPDAIQERETIERITQPTNDTQTPD